jgi:ABC-type branched-subunit amino acid transport system ATPase component
MNRKFLSILPAGLLLIGGLVVGGCGSSSTTTTATITKTEFVAKGNAICVAGQKAQNLQVEAYAKKHGFKQNQEPTKAQEVELAEHVLIPNIQSQINAVKALGAPSGEEKQVNSALEASQQALDKFKANPELVFAKESPFHAAGVELHALGLTQCAKHT